MSNEENQDISRLGKTAEEFNKVAGKYIEGSVKASVYVYSNDSRLN